MNSSKPYILRALHEWILDNDCTPYVLVAVDAPGVSVPEGYAENGQMVLNTTPSAVREFVIDNEAIRFESRFSGVPHFLYVPIAAVLAIYAQENGQGMFFELELSESSEQGDDGDEVELGWSSPVDLVDSDSTASEGSDRGDSGDEPPEPPDPPPAGGRPNLRIVK